MKIGVFYQSGHKLVACYMAIQQFRKFYPDAPIALYEDGSTILENVANEFNCVYKHIGTVGINNQTSGRVFKGEDGPKAWLDRIYDACTTTLKDVDWVIHYEDDVWCLREIKIPPRFDISGAIGPLYTTELYEYLKTKFGINNTSRNVWSMEGSLENYGACGGAIFNRLKFIEIYNRLNEVPWDEINKLDTRPYEWCDATLSFLFQFFGYTSGGWDDWSQYDSKNIGNWFDKSGWSVPMKEQKDATFIHFYKHFYNYTPEELELAKNKIV
jgi:hypothetical protein